MPILIPNMEMPKRCCDCWMCYDGYVCMATDTNFYGRIANIVRNNSFDEDWTTERLPNCPLMDIDVDAEVLNILIQMSKKYTYLELSEILSRIADREKEK